MDVHLTQLTTGGTYGSSDRLYNVALRTELKLTQ